MPDQTPANDTSSPVSPEEVIDSLYEVAIDPMRYETLLDHWEAMIGPRRGHAGFDEQTPGLRQFAGHFERAAQVLDRVARDPTPDGVDAMVARVGHAAAFAVDRSLRVVAVNVAGAAVLGVTRGAALRDLALDDDAGPRVAAQVARLFSSHAVDPVVLRLRAARPDRLMVLHLRLIAPPGAAPHVLAVTSELGWPPGFSDLLRHAFDLTPAETDVMRALAEGHPLPRIAQGRGRSVETIRAQLKSIMSKTETSSQTELVRLTLSTMEMAQFSDDAARHLDDMSRGFGSLPERPFRTMTLPDGRRFDYLILGDPCGAPVLFLPLDYGLVRWPATAECDAARRGMRIIVPVRPGYGHSTPLPPGVPYVRQIADDLSRLLDHLGVARVPVLSLGGDSFIAIAFHAAHPARVRALVACAGVLPLNRPEQYDRMDKWHRFILAGARYTPHLLPFMVKAGFALARRLGKRGFIHVVYGKSAADVATFEIPEVFEAIVCGSEVALSDTHSAHDAFAREVISHETTDWTGAMTALAGAIPVHFLNGLQDPQVPPATLDEYRADHPWIDFRIYPDAGQLLFFLKWRDALALVERYLR